jgi:hypothetical protein
MRFVRALQGDEGGPLPARGIVLIASFGASRFSLKPARYMDFPALFC